MVLVPVGQGMLLDRIGLPPSTDAPRGVLEVSFDDIGSLDQAIQLVAEGLRRELRYELVAYRRHLDEDALDLNKAAEALGVTPQLIRQALDEEVLDAAGTYSHLFCKFDRDELIQGRWSKATLTIRSQSGTDLERVLVTVNGPVEVLPTPIEVDLPARTSVDITVSIRPRDIGDFPIEIGLAAKADRDLAPLLPRHDFWFKSVAPPPENGS